VLALALMLSLASGVRLSPTVRLQPNNTEILTAIQIHGNLATTDDEVRRLADLQVGMPVAPDIVEAVTVRLDATKRFERVEVLKRFASISDPSQIVLVIIVYEGPVHVELTGDPNQLTRVVRTRGPNFLYLPIVSAEDGYGLTYGVRLALPNPAGPRTRLSFPLTWGGDKRASAEFEKTFEDAPVTRVLAGAAISRRTNPYFQEDDDRKGVWARAEREIVHGVRVGATVAWDKVSFGRADERFTRGGADVVLDTRLDTVLPRNAVYARASWDHLAFSNSGAMRSELEARGYIGLVRQNILVLRVLRDDSNVPLPPYLQPMLGGDNTVRGFKAGTAVGDTLMSASAEIVIPLTSPLSFGKFGVSVFTDAGTIYNKGARLTDQDWRHGTGGSVWFAATLVRFSVAVAHGVGGPADSPVRSTRVHVGGTISF
jgi:outer membrane protein assembly factor BamA